jgi:hypothetical protein
VTVRGRVLDPDGRPFAGAKVYFSRPAFPGPAPALATTDARGRFHFRISPNVSEKEQGIRGAVIGVGTGHGPGIVLASRAEQLANVTVKLVKDLPIEGRVISLEGKPIPGAAARKRGRRVDPALLGLTAALVTAADGTFRVKGVGRERLVVLRFEGPTIETSEVYALTHPTRGIGAYHGAKLDHAAAPTLPIVGTVRVKETGKPAAGVTILTPIASVLGRQEFPGQDLRHYLRATTDSKGRYRLVGLPRSRAGEHLLFAVSAAGQPYLTAAKLARGDTESASLEVDFELARGVVIRGRVTNKETGRPVPARVEYFAAGDNPNVRAEEGLWSPIPTRTAKDGSFTLVGVPGQGLLAAVARAPEEMAYRYLVAAGADRVKITRQGFYFRTEPTWCAPEAFNTLVEINPARGAKSFDCNLTLDPGKTVTGTIVGPDGKPVKGVRIERELSPHIPLRIEDLPTAQFRLPAIDPKRPWTFIFRHPGQNLAAALAFKGEAKPVRVRLQKCATLRGRLVDEKGKPRAGVGLINSAHRGEVHIRLGEARTDRDGRFRIEGIIPGMKVRVATPLVANVVTLVIPEVTLKPGETKDVGDVKAQAE